jgi:hypothetical protein
MDKRKGERETSIFTTTGDVTEESSDPLALVHNWQVLLRK